MGNLREAFNAFHISPKLSSILETLVCSFSTFVPNITDSNVSRQVNVLSLKTITEEVSREGFLSCFWTFPSCALGLTEPHGVTSSMLHTKQVRILKHFFGGRNMLIWSLSLRRDYLWLSEMFLALYRKYVFIVK